MRHHIRAAFLLGAALCTLAPPAQADTLSLAASRPTYCPVAMTPDNLVVIAYRAVLSLVPACPPGGIARVRKASTLNRSAPYRPIKPDGSPQYGGLWGWTLTGSGGNVPASELWTSWNWTWEYWDGEAWRSARRP